MILITPRGRVHVDRGKAFPISTGGRSKTYAPNAGTVPLLTRDTLAATYEAMYRHQPWVHIVVNKITRGVARLPIKVFRTLADDSRERVRDHPLVRLLHTPYPRGNAWHLKESIEGSVEVHGNALIYKARGGPGQPPTQLWPLPWRHIEAKTDASGLVMDHYRFHGESEILVIHPDDVIHVRNYGLGTGIGISPIEALRLTLGIEHAAQNFQGETFRNAAAISGVFTVPQGGKPLRDATVERIMAQLDALYGGVERAGRFAVLEGGMDFHPVQHSPVDLALIEMRKLNREEVAAAYDVPPPAIGILDRATFSNITEQRRMLYVDAIGPRTENIEQAFAAQLINPEPAFAELTAELDLSAILQGDPERRSQAYQRWLQGVYTPDELRRLENLPPVGGDGAQLWMPANLIPVGASREDLELRARILEAHARILAAGGDPAPADPEPGDMPPTMDP